MQENSFEKDIRQKMESLSFEPSEPVWQKVELQIQQKQRRRRLVLLLLPLLLAGGAFTWYLSYSVNPAATSVAQQSNKKPDVVTSNPVAETATSITESQTATAESVIEKSAQKEKETFITQPSLTQNQKGKETFANQQFITQKQKEKQTFTALFNNKKRKEKSESKETETDFFANEMHALILQNEVDKKEGRVAENENIENPFQKKAADWKKLSDLANSYNEMEDDQPLQDSAQQSIAQADSNHSDSAVAATIQKSKTKSDVWQWSLQARAGVAGLRTKVTNVFNNDRQADFTAAPSTGNNIPQVRIANNVKNHLAFTIGGSARRKIKNNTFASLGLQYSYYSTQTKVGNRVNADTAMYLNGRLTGFNSYYTNTGSAHNYTTHYHFLELPVAIDYTPFKKWPLQLQHGFSLGYLMSSNALFQNNSGIYVQSEKGLKKTNFHFFTSVEYPLLNRPGFMLLAGPQLQWALTPVEKAGAYKRQHLFFGGLHTQLRFKK